MFSEAPTKEEKSTTKPTQKIQGDTGGVNGVIHLSDKRRIVTCSYDSSLRIWDLDSGTQVGDAWKDEGSGYLFALALSPDGKKVASGSFDGAVRLWDIDTGKVIKKWKGHTRGVKSVCWSPDGGRVASGSDDDTFRVWNVESGKTIIGPIKAGDDTVWAVCYSPDGMMIATGADDLKIWDANTGGLLKTLEESALYLAWILDGTTLITLSDHIRKFDTATWTETATVLDGHKHLVCGISLSPNERILATISVDKTVRLWNIETNNQPIGPPLHHKDDVRCVTFSADGKFLVVGCKDDDIYTWDVSAIVREAGLDHLLSDNVNTVKKPFNMNADVTRPRPSKIEHTRSSRLPPGFFDDFPTPRGQSDHHIQTQRQPTLLGRLPSFLRRRSNPRGETERAQSRSSPRRWAKNRFSGTLRRQDRSDIQLREPPVVNVPCAPGNARNYHARGKKATSFSRPLNTYVMQQPSGATQSNLSSFQQPPATTPTTLPVVTGTVVATEIISRPDLVIKRAGWRARFMLWVCCVPVQNIDDQH